MFNIDNIIYGDRTIENYNNDIFNNMFSNSHSLNNIDSSYNFNNMFSEFHSLNNIDSSYNFNNYDISLDENNYFFKEENLQPINPIQLDKCITFGEKSTNIKTKNERIFPNFYSFNEIINKISDNEIIKKLKSDIKESDEYYYLKFLKKKKKGENHFNLIIEKQKNSDKKKKRKKN